MWVRKSRAANDAEASLRLGVLKLAMSSSLGPDGVSRLKRTIALQVVTMSEAAFLHRSSTYREIPRVM